MKYQTSIEIDLPLDRVIQLFDNTQNLYKWQPELKSFDHISGEPGKVGATSRLKYQMGKREVEMIETITERDLPHQFSGTYEAKGVFNHICNRFMEVSPGRTRWVADNEFRFSGLMAIMSIFMKKAFKKQTAVYLKRFKEFAEAS